MTKLLEKALSRVARLPEAEQDEIAQIIIDELVSKGKWEARFRKSTNLLEKTAFAATAENRAGKTRASEV